MPDDLLSQLAYSVDQKEKAISINPRGKAVKEKDYDDFLSRLAASQPEEKPRRFQSNSVVDTLGRGAMGLKRGVEDVADTVASGVIAPITSFIDNKLFGSKGGEQRQKELDERIRQQNEEYEEEFGDSGVAGAGRIAGNIIATLPAFELGGAGVVAMAPRLATIPGVSSIVNRVGQARQAINAEKTAAAAGLPIQPAGAVNKLISAGSRTAGLSAGGAAIGAGSNLATSSSNEQPLGEQLEHGAKVGAVLGPVGPYAFKAGEKIGQMAYRAVEPFTERGREKVANRLIERFADGGPLPPVASRDTRQYVPGSEPTLATATNNPGLATLERGIRDSNPSSVNRFTDLDRRNTEARNLAFEARRGDETTLGTLRAERESSAIPKLKQAFDKANKTDADPRPVINMIERELKGPSGKRSAVVEALNEVKGNIIKPYPLKERVSEAIKGVNQALKGKLSSERAADFTEARRLLNSANRGYTSEEDLIKGLNKLAEKQKTVGAIDEALKFIKRGDTRLETDPEILYGVRKAIGDSLSKAAKGTTKDRSLAAKELSDVMSSLDRVMEKAAPGFKDYLRTYAEKSKPIDTQKVLQKMNLTDQEGNVMGNRLDSAIKQIEQRRKMPGANPEKSIDQQTMDFLYSLRNDFRRSNRLKAGSPKGSPTFQNLATASAIGDIMGPLSLVVGHHHPILVKLASYLYRGADEDVLNKVTNKLLDPRYQQVPGGAPRITAPQGNRLLPKAGVAAGTRLLSGSNAP